MDVAGEVEVDLLHRRDLRATAAGRATLGAEDRPERGLAQRDAPPRAALAQAVGKTERERRRPLARRRRRPRRHAHEPALAPRARPLDRLPANPARVAAAA